MTLDVPPQLLTLWPKLTSSLRLIEKWGGRTGVVFISQDDQAREACDAIATAIGWPLVTFDAARILKSQFDEAVYDVLLCEEEQGDLFAEKIDRLCIVIPRIDRQGEWISSRIKFLCEHAKRPFVVLATAHDEDWIPSYLQGHLSVCRKRGASKGSRHQSE